MDKYKIIEAFNANGSDKSSYHHYEVGYSQILPDKVNNLLEIGIGDPFEKSSIHAWHNIYPSANIYAIDIMPEKMINDEFIKTFVVDQSDRAQLENFKKTVGAKFDVIVDDGSHQFAHASLSYEVLKDCLAEGGIYIVEDIQKIQQYDYQCISDWSEYLDAQDINYKIIDCKPDLHDNSLMIYMYK